MFDRVRPIDSDVQRDLGEAVSRPPERPAGAELRPCTHCGARVQELRRGRCWGCYQAWAGLRPVGRGARCVVCYERRSDALRLAEIHGRWLPMCHVCASRTQVLSPVPYTIDGLRRNLARDRRGEDRRVGALDPRPVGRERRQVDRRASAAPPSLTDQANRARAGRRARAGNAELGDFVFDLDLDDLAVMEVTGVVDDLSPEHAARVAAEAAAPAPQVISAEGPTAPNPIERPEREARAAEPSVLEPEAATG